MRRPVLFVWQIFLLDYQQLEDVQWNVSTTQKYADKTVVKPRSFCGRIFVVLWQKYFPMKCFI